MIKNLIFDLDNTIIKDEISDAIFYKEALSSLGYNPEEYLQIYGVIDKYELNFSEEYNFFNKKELIDFINSSLNKNYSYDLADKLIEAVGNKWIERVILKENTLKKLSEKYNLYIYTNYFQIAQEKRIELIGYSKYFKKIFGADIYGSKPYKSSFKRVLKEIGDNADECIMIGDTKNIDIIAANKVGMKAILFDYDGKRDRKEVKAKNYIVIKDINNIENALNKNI